MTRSSSRAAAQPKACVARRAVPDHAVGGVDRLIERGARKPADRHPKNRRDDRRRKNSRPGSRSPRARRRPQSSVAVSRPTMCATASAAGDEAVLFQGGGDIGDMAIQASLRDQRAGEERRGDRAERQAQQGHVGGKTRAHPRWRARSAWRRCRRHVAPARPRFRD